MIEVRDKNTGQLYGVYYGFYKNYERVQVFIKSPVLNAGVDVFKSEADTQMVMEKVVVELGFIRHRQHEHPVLYVENETDMHDVSNYVDLVNLGKLRRFC